MISAKNKLFLLKRHFLTLDGLWMIELEKQLGWDKALQIDLDVWIKLLKMIFSDLKKFLNLKTGNLPELITILTFRWTAEGWKFEIFKKNNDKIEIEIQNCPYNSAMKRNPKRHNRIPLICKNMCIPFYESIISYYNPDIELERNKFMGLNDDICHFSFSSKNMKKIDDNDLENAVVKELSKKAELFYYQSNFNRLNNLWIKEIITHFDLRTAFLINDEVWKSLYLIFFRRLSRYLQMDKVDIEKIIKLISYVSESLDNEVEVHKEDTNKVKFKIKRFYNLEFSKQYQNMLGKELKNRRWEDLLISLQNYLEKNKPRVKIREYSNLLIAQGEILIQQYEFNLEYES